MGGLSALNQLGERQRPGCREREKVRERQKGSKKLQFVSLRPDQGSVGVVCSDRKLASIPLPVYLQEAERDEIRLKVNGI